MIASAHVLCMYWLSVGIMRLLRLVCLVSDHLECNTNTYHHITMLFIVFKNKLN